MGFRSGAYATVWEITPNSQTRTDGRISISRKNKETDEIVQDFGGFVYFVGTASASKAAGLKAKDRIKLGDVDVSNRYDKETGKTYTSFKIFSFDVVDNLNQSPPTTPTEPTNNEPQPTDNGSTTEYPWD